MAKHPQELSAADVRHQCSVKHFKFKTTEDIPFSRTIIGQPRGIRAIEFGIDIEADGFNIYILGPTGSGRTTAVKHFLEEYAKDGAVPSDWVYVHNFESAHHPQAIEFAAGEGHLFCTAMERLIETLLTDIPRALEAEEFAEAMETIEKASNERRQNLFDTFSEEAKEKGFALGRTPQGLMLAPTGEDGNPLTPEQLNELSEEAHDALETAHAELQEKLQDSLRKVRDIDREFREDQERMKRAAAGSAIDLHINDLREGYAEHADVLEYLKQIREDVLEHVDDFQDGEEEEMKPGLPGALAQAIKRRAKTDEKLRRYKTNLLVDHSKTEGAPVIVEDLPTYANLVGRIEGEVQMGALRTDFTMIRPGALHQANGGYLVLRVSTLLTQPGAWDGLKRALNNREVRIEESLLRTGIGILTPQTVDPEPIPLSLKVILLGSPSLYYALYGLEEEFSDLFKVKADFASMMPRDHETENEYATFIAARCHENNLPHFTPAAVGQMVEFGSRMADDQSKLSTLFGTVADIVQEAAYWARRADSKTVDAEHVEQALNERRYRGNLFEERVQERIEEGTIYIDTEGEVVGQVNGLSVVGLGDVSFGQPSRVTARVYTGKEGVVAIDREVEMAGPIHNKGLMILRGYLGGQYALEHPLTLSASLTFEQNYGGIEGDSASTTELYALLSALSGYPIKQSLAITGSVNQRGQVQPIGGANEKIEGFFDVCSARGLTGEQGVLIPRANVRNLMLREDVVQAIADGQFHIYAVATVDEGIALLTGVDAGVPDADGVYGEGTIHASVAARLHDLYVKSKDEDE